MDNDGEELAPKKGTLFPLTADDILDNALQNLDERQARDVTKKAAEEVVRVAVEKRMAEHRSGAAQEEMRNLINNANLLDGRGGDYKINSTFETASGTTSVEIRKSKSTRAIAVAVIAGLLVVLLALVMLSARQ
ncbi:MAG: hypothetical protein M3430_08200 [Acidobacteriota bacterium]|nr:hypothetical protein [Acidobacteriota bacterium]